MVRHLLTAATAWVGAAAYTALALHYDLHKAVGCAMALALLILFAPFVPRL